MTRHKNLIAVSVVLLLVALYFLIDQTGFFNMLIEPKVLTDKIKDLGIQGPALIIALMVLAIIFNPLPSAPIALAAGAVYGHTWGTLYIMTGALLGATGAFLIARFTGYDFIEKHIGEKLPITRLSSQNNLMGIIFISRLIPFLSFDLMSYAAGLTPITLGRFMLATLLGLIPMSFLLAHFGSKAIALDTQTQFFVVFVLGGITLIPLLFSFLKSK